VGGCPRWIGWFAEGATLVSAMKWGEGMSGDSPRQARLVELFKAAVSLSGELSEYEKAALQRIVPWLVEMAVSIYEETVPPFEQGAPTRLFRKLEEEDLINSQRKVFNFFARFVKESTLQKEDAVCAAALYALHTSLFELTWHEQFADKFAEQGGKLQGLYMLAPVVR
jgi:hypothetical protein